MNGIVVGLDVLAFIERPDKEPDQGVSSPGSLRSPRTHKRPMREEDMTEGRGSLASAPWNAFDSARLDRLLDEAGIDALVMACKHGSLSYG